MKLDKSAINKKVRLAAWKDPDHYVLPLAVTSNGTVLCETRNGYATYVVPHKADDDSWEYSNDA